MSSSGPNTTEEESSTYASQDDILKLEDFDEHEHENEQENEDEQENERDNEQDIEQENERETDEGETVKVLSKPAQEFRFLLAIPGI